MKITKSGWSTNEQGKQFRLAMCEFWHGTGQRGDGLLTGGGRSPFADPGYGTGFAGHGTMAIRTRFAGTGDRPLKGGGPGARK